MGRKLLVIVLKSLLIGMVMTAFTYYFGTNNGDFRYVGFPFYYYEIVWMGTNVLNIAGLIGDIFVWAVIPFTILILLKIFRGEE